MSPAPNSTCVNTDNEKHSRSSNVNMFPKRQVENCFVTNITRNRKNEAYLTPPFSWGNSSQSQVNSATSSPVVGRQGARQNGCVFCSERSLQRNVERKNRIKHLPDSQRQTTDRPVMYLYRLWYMHPVDFYVWHASHHILVVLLIPVKKVCGINAHTYRSLWSDYWLVLHTKEPTTVKERFSS